MTLRAERLAKAYGPTVAVRDASITLDAGEVVAVEGPSGGGKSTLLRLLAGVETPDRGAVWLDGSELSSLSHDERARRRRSSFGVVLQFGGLVPDLSLIDNVALPLLLAGIKGREARRRALAILDEVGVAARARLRPGEVSGGEAQRAAVGRALVHAPAVLLADEPTGALDSVTSGQVLKLLLSAASDRRAAVIIVTHDDAVATYAGRRVFICDGVTDPRSHR